jgi:hypothetical protein
MCQGDNYPSEEHLQRLANTVQLVLDQLQPSEAGVEAIPASAPALAPVEQAPPKPDFAPAPTRPPVAHGARSGVMARMAALRTSSYRWPLAGGLAIVLLLLAGFGARRVLAGHARSSRSTTASGAVKSPPTPAPLAQLPRTVTIVPEDVGAQSKVGEADTDLRAVLATFEADYGLDEARRWTVHLYSDEATARQRMAELGLAAADIDSFFRDKRGRADKSNGDAQDSVLYLPDLTDLRGTLAYYAARYALRNDGGIDNADVYPWWFEQGFEFYVESRFNRTQFVFHPNAVADAKAGTAPALGSIALLTNIQAKASQSDALVRAAAKGEATVEFVVRRKGDGGLGRLLKANARGSVQKFNDTLPSVVGMSLDQLNGAVDASLKTEPSVNSTSTVSAGPGGSISESRACPDWTGTWSTTFGPMHLTSSGNAIVGTYIYQGAEGRISGTVSGNVLAGTWSEPPTYQAPEHAGDFRFVLAQDGRSFSGQWRNGSSGNFNPNWTGSCTGGG